MLLRSWITHKYAVTCRSPANRFKCATKLLIYISSDIIFGEIQIRNHTNCACKFIFLQQNNKILFMIIRYCLIMKLYINDQYFPTKSFLIEKSASTISMINVIWHHRATWWNYTILLEKIIKNHTLLNVTISFESNSLWDHQDAAMIHGLDT